MAYTQADLDKLQAAIAKGVLQLRNGNGELVTYRSLAEMERILQLMKSELASPLTRRRRVYYPSFRRYPCDTAG